MKLWLQLLCSMQHVSCQCSEREKHAVVNVSDLATNVSLLWGTADGADVQSALGQITKRSTVPQVFIGGTFVGGCDGTNHAIRNLCSQPSVDCLEGCKRNATFYHRAFAVLHCLTCYYMCQTQIGMKDGLRVEHWHLSCRHYGCLQVWQAAIIVEGGRGDFKLVMCRVHLS